MNFRQMKDDEIGLILHGLRSVYVQDIEPVRERLIAACESALAGRGKSLPAT